jgi:serine/threonine protein kinase
MQIAVKRLKNTKNGTEVEFASEVEILGRIRHKNLLSFRGYCADGPERILVYDYMANSSLYAHLHGPLSAECLLDWRRRASIAIGAARALLSVNYLIIFAHNRIALIIYTLLLLMTLPDITDKGFLTGIFITMQHLR